MFQSLPEATRVELARILLVILVFCLTWLVRPLFTGLLARTRQLGGLDTTIRRLISVPVGYFLIALAIDLSARILEVDDTLMTLVVHVTRTLIIVALALMIYRLVELLILSRRQVHLLTGMSIDEALLPFIRTGIQLLALALALVIIVQEWGYDVTGLIAGLGIGGLAISLAAQDTLSNLFGFAAIVSDRPFVVGEYVKTKDVEGAIERVGLRSTRVRQNDQAVVSVPNSLLAGSAILNWSRLSKRKLELTLAVSYKTRPDEMEELLARLRTLLSGRPLVDAKTVVVFFVGFGDSSLNILVRCYMNIADWGKFSAEQESILLEIMHLVEDMGLQIAFPSRSLYLENVGSGFTIQPRADDPVQQAKE